MIRVVDDSARNARKKEISRRDSRAAGHTVFGEENKSIDCRFPVGPADDCASSSAAVCPTRGRLQQAQKHCHNTKTCGVLDFAAIAVHRYTRPGGFVADQTYRSVPRTRGNRPVCVPDPSRHRPRGADDCYILPRIR